MNQYLVEKYGASLRTYSVEVEIESSTNNTYRLPDESILRNSKIVAIFIVRNPDDNAKSQIGRDIVPDSVLDSSYLTLFDGNKRKVEFLPLSAFAIGKDYSEIKPFSLECFTPSKSQIDISSSVTPTVGDSFLLNFVYLDEEEN